MAKPKCYFDIEIGGVAAGRVVIEVSKPEMVTSWRTWTKGVPLKDAWAPLRLAYLV